MVQTITPVVHGGKRTTWGASVAAHVVGTTLSAAALGAVLGGLGALVGAPWGRGGPVVVALVACVYALRELLGIPVPLPNLHRQVPEWWRTFFSPPVTSFLYGLGLGVGFVTYLSFGTLASVGAVAVATGRPLLGLAVMAPFGVARGLSVLVARSATTNEGVHRVVDRLDALAVTWWPRVVNGVALGAVAVVSAFVAAGQPGRPASGAAAWVLAAIFAWAGVSKTIRPAAWRRSLDGYELPGWIRTPATVAVPFAEVVVVALVASGLEVAAGSLALGLLAVFSLAIVRARLLRGDRLDCGCFGGRRRLDYRAMLGRNAFVTLVAFAGITAPPPGGARSLGVPHGEQILAASLAAVGFVLLAIVVRAIAATWSPRRA